MNWFLLTLSSIILWGITDIFLKKSLHHSDSLSHYKTFIWIGLVMAPAGCVAAICSDTLLESIRMLADELYLVPLCALYVLAMFFGLLGAKHLDASVVSPLENIDGAIAAIILYLFFLFTNNQHITKSVSVMDMFGAVSITIGIVLLGIQEHKLSKQEINFEDNKKGGTKKYWKNIILMENQDICRANMRALHNNISFITKDVRIMFIYK